MIIACPACTTRYVVPDSAIGVDGRTVRCAKCRHSWFQDGPQVRPAEATTAPPPPPPPAGEPQTVAPPATDEAPPGLDADIPPQGWSEPQPAAEVPVYAPEPPVAGQEPPAFAPEPPPLYSDPVPSRSEPPFEDTPSSFAHEPPFRPRRNPARLWTGAAVAFALVVAALIGAVSYWGVPGWVPSWTLGARPTFGAAQPDLVLEFPPDRQDRRTLPNGAEFFGASGTVTNVGEETRRVPPILIVLRDGRDRKVYEWEIRAPKGELAPGESVTINEAVTDVPRSAKFAEIGWKPV
jgi:predicted Zn finger-like uncharacterized protein